MYSLLEAEVAGGLGAGTDYDVSRVPRLSGTLHYEFEDWFGDDIVTTAGFWCVTARLAEALRESGLSGVRLEDVVVSTSETWAELPHAHELGEGWARLVPSGDSANGDDVCLERQTRLVLSDAALAVFRGFQLENATISPADEPEPVSDIMAQFLKMQEERAAGK